ncbi:hypothetical protein D3OALGB2SA_2521, partial [Olavius algarvensis associated proteobacterium Delta 3]
DASEPPDDDDLTPPKTGSANSKFVSTTDPDASVQRKGAGRSKLQYKVHRAVDETHEVITATTVTSASVNEANLMAPLLNAHKRTMGKMARVCVADSKYGTIGNYLACYDMKVKGHFESIEK